MSSGAKKYAFWYGRSQFWTHGDPFREHFRILMFFVENVRFTQIMMKKSLCSKSLRSIWAPEETIIPCIVDLLHP